MTRTAADSEATRSGGPGPASEEQARAYVDDLVARAREQATRARELADQLEALTSRGRAADGSCEVTVGHGGGLVDLWLSPVLAQAPPHAVRRVVLEANAAARRAMSEEVVALAGAHHGHGSAAAEEIARPFAAMLGAPAGPGRAAGPPSRPGGVLR